MNGRMVWMALALFIVAAAGSSARADVGYHRSELLRGDGAAIADSP